MCHEALCCRMVINNRDIAFLWAKDLWTLIGGEWGRRHIPPGREGSGGGGTFHQGGRGVGEEAHSTRPGSCVTLPHSVLSRPCPSIALCSN